MRIGLLSLALHDLIFGRATQMPSYPEMLVVDFTIIPSQSLVICRFEYVTFYYLPTKTKVGIPSDTSTSSYDYTIIVLFYEH